MKNTIFLGLLCLGIATASFAQQTTSSMIGGMSQQEFDRINKEGAAKVAAITPTNAPLSSADKDLMLQVAKGGMQQLEVSRAAVQKVTDPQVRLLAQSEVEEQTGLSAKLKEIAKSKNVQLPTAPDSKTQEILTKMQGMSGSQLDQYYVQESGVTGHEQLDQVMSKVESQASDANLKALAAAAHPLVKTHLTVSQATLAKMKTGKSSSGK